MSSNVTFQGVPKKLEKEKRKLLKRNVEPIFPFLSAAKCHLQFFFFSVLTNYIVDFFCCYNAVEWVFRQVSYVSLVAVVCFIITHNAILLLDLLVFHFHLLTYTFCFLLLLLFYCKHCILWLYIFVFLLCGHGYSS